VSEKTIAVNIANVAPTITSIDIPANIEEGDLAKLKVAASDAGNDTFAQRCLRQIVYRWYINNSTTPVQGKEIDYRFADSGNYSIKEEISISVPLPVPI
jgi:hypothetical protein